MESFSELILKDEDVHVFMFCDITNIWEANTSLMSNLNKYDM